MTTGTDIPLIRLERVSRILPGIVPAVLVRDIDLISNAGEFIAITGPSGSVKSSLLYLLGLLDRPSAGRLLFDGHDTAFLADDSLARLRLERIGFVFQFHFLLGDQKLFLASDTLFQLSVRFGSFFSHNLPNTRIRCGH